ncbi:MAG: hypothetical protein WC517_00525 [Patescibacteria group bacterium]
MAVFFDFLSLFFLFAVLGLAADSVVKNIKHIASVFKIRLIFFGILLGLITTLPELAVGINAAISGAPALSVGNLLSGVIVIFGLVLGVSLFLNRQISTDSKWSVLIPEAAVILSPILLGLDGKYGLLDGLIMIGAYLGLVFYLYQSHLVAGSAHLEKADKKGLARAIFVSVAGIIFILLASHWIISITLDLLSYVAVSRLAIGSLVFAIGTNLPEITIALTSWRKKASELSLSHLVSSAFTNILVLGIVAVINPIFFGFDLPFGLLAAFLGLIVVLFLIFHQSDGKMDRREGLVLLSVYALFLIANLWLLNR